MKSLPQEQKEDFISGEWAMYYEQLAEHSAWYSGDIDQLTRFYATTHSTPQSNGRFWGENVKADDRRTVIHVPLAGDIATFSSDMLFSEQPDIKIPEAHERTDDGSLIPNKRATKAELRLQEIIEKGGMNNRLLEAAETASALGGVYLKPTWDKEVLDVPILTIAQPDNAFPIFKYGILSSVIFHKIVRDEDGKIYRLLEHYKKGSIESALYVGDSRALGRRVALDYIEETEGIEDVLVLRMDRLLARYIANKRPHKRFRGTDLGMSDIQGSETLMDALDLTMTSWIRDIVLGRGRLHVPQDMLNVDDNGRTNFDGGQEVYVELDVDASMMGDGKSPITATQFAIRTEEHYKTAVELTTKILHMAGYSPQTFGLNMDGGISTQSHEIRERKTLITKQRKERFFKDPLEDVLQMMLEIDNIHLDNDTPFEFRPNATFADTLGHDIGSVASTVQMLKQAESASIKVRVQMLHPDWTLEMVEDEVNTIREEAGLNVEQPTEFGGKVFVD